MLFDFTIDVTDEELAAMRANGAMDFEVALNLMDRFRGVARREVACPTAETLVESLKRQPYAQVETGEGLRPAFACAAEDGCRAIVIALDPLEKWPTTRPDVEAFEELLWLKGERSPVSYEMRKLMPEEELTKWTKVLQSVSNVRLEELSETMRSVKAWPVFWKIMGWPRIFQLEDTLNAELKRRKEKK